MSAEPESPPGGSPEVAPSGRVFPLDRAMSSRNPARAVYGTVIALSLIAVEGGHGGIPRLTFVVVVTQVVYWLAHTYAELVGGRIVTGHRPHRGEIQEVLAEEWPLVTASFEPLAATLLAALLGASATAAALIGICAGTLMLALWAWVAGRRAHLRTGEQLLYVVVSTLFGAAVVLLKIVLH